MDLPGLSGKNFYLYILLVLPEFIAQSVYDLFIPHGERDASASLFLGLAYGTVNLVLTWPLVYWTVYAVSDDSIQTRLLAYGALLFSLALFPALLGVATYRMRNSALLTRWGLVTPHPISPGITSSRVARRETCWVIFRLKSGSMIGGHYGLGSHTSSFPNEADIYVSEVWLARHITKANSTRASRWNDGNAYWNGSEDCELIEFLQEEP